MGANIKAALAQGCLLTDMMRRPHDGEPEFYRTSLKHVASLILEEHYTARCPGDPMHVFVWAYGNEVVAAATFTSPVNKFFGKGAVELSRLVRRPSFTLPLSRFIALCLGWLKRNTDLAYCLSYADSTAGHCGTVYQASNFIFVAESKGNTMWRDAAGKLVSGRSFDQRSAGNKAGWERVRSGRKFLYVYPLRERRAKLLARFGWTPLLYPKKTPGGEAGGSCML